MKSGAAAGEFALRLHAGSSHPAGGRSSETRSLVQACCGRPDGRIEEQLSSRLYDSLKDKNNVMLGVLVSGPTRHQFQPARRRNRG